MIDYRELVAIFSVPRPNASPGIRRTASAMRGWLTRQGIPYRVQAFQLFPYFFESIGLWLIASRTLLVLAVGLRWGWWILLIAIVGLLGGLLDVALNLPIVCRPGKCRGENILIEFGPADPRQELVLSAHYDTKTEMLDHRKRMFLLRSLRFGIFLTLLLGVLGPLDRWLLSQGSVWSAYTYALGLALSVPLLLLAWALGLNLSTGRLLPPSQGSVDNGSACAILLGLAERLQREAGPASSTGPAGTLLRQTRVTLAVFAGEEVNMQGSRAYVRQRSWPLPAAAVNLEVMAQDGEYVLWELDGSVFRLEPTSAALNQALEKAVSEVTGRPPRPVGPLTSDGGSFLLAGIPAATLGTYDTRLVDTGFHSPADHPGRVVLERLPESVEILWRLIADIDRSSSVISPRRYRSLDVNKVTG